jgi:hypothetical protein
MNASRCVRQASDNSIMENIVNLTGGICAAQFIVLSDVFSSLKITHTQATFSNS